MTALKFFVVDSALQSFLKCEHLFARDSSVSLHQQRIKYEIFPDTRSAQFSKSVRLWNTSLLSFIVSVSDIFDPTKISSSLGFSQPVVHCFSLSRARNTFVHQLCLTFVLYSDPMVNSFRIADVRGRLITSICSVGCGLQR